MKLELISKCVDSPIGDIIFIHGLGGDGQSTWTFTDSVGKGTKEKKFDSYFPAVFAADFADSNVWALDYSADVTKWADNPQYNELGRHCSEILEYLLGRDIGSLPIILVCHSLGGIVAKDILRKSQQARGRHEKFYKNTKAVSFLATPHKGSNWADFANNVNSILPFLRTTDRVQELEKDNLYLEELSSWYRAHSLDTIETQAFFEQRKTSGISIVPHYSANPDVIHCTPIPINANHIEIAKPISKDDSQYVALTGLVKHHFYNDELDERWRSYTGVPKQTVVIGIVVNDRKVLMVRRKNPIDNLTWQFVAGRLKVGQEMEETCIIREIREETSIHVRSIRRLGEQEDGDSSFRRVYWTLEYISGKIKNQDPEENDDVKWVRIDEVSKHITSPLSSFAINALEEAMSNS